MVQLHGQEFPPKEDEEVGEDGAQLDLTDSGVREPEGRRCVAQGGGRVRAGLHALTAVIRALGWGEHRPEPPGLPLHDGGGAEVRDAGGPAPISLSSRPRDVDRVAEGIDVQSGGVPLRGARLKDARSKRSPSSNSRMN